MASNKLEYDSTLGGSVTLPTHVSTFRYAANVVKEMRQLIDEVRNPVSRKLVFQTLPKHMRRRAMSHHPKRLPRKYRAAHRSQMAKAGKPQQTKCPSRKHRRRPGNLLRDYLRRQRRNVWLETHIWHAKRFHMVERWGYRLPQASCDKTYRACYRASAEHCLLQDMSFYVCIEMKGTIVNLREGFARLSSTKCGLSIAAKTYTTGRREGNIDLFRDGKYPEYALGRISFMWQPVFGEQTNNSEGDIKRTLWLWIHPSAYLAVLEELIKVFELTKLNSIKVPLKQAETMDDNSENKETINKSLKKLKPKEQRCLQFMTKNKGFERIQRYRNSSSNIELNDLKDTVNRFRLTGHLSQSVLNKTFKPKSPTEDAPTTWLHTLLKENTTFHRAHENQIKFWQNCNELRSPGELLSNMILSLNIEDPRLHRPKKRTKALPATPTSQNNLDFILTMPDDLAHSPLWNADLRDGLCKSMIKPSAYSKLRAKHAAVPGARCQFEEEMQAVPVILIQRPGSQRSQYKRLGYGCGWDVIAPAGYGMPIWLSLIMWGAKPGGLREFESVAREMGTEEHLPDTVAGHVLAANRHQQLRSKYFRKPPNKRHSYKKLAIVSPFRAPFQELIRDWTVDLKQITNELNTFHVLRDRNLLQQLLLHIQGKSQIFPTDIPENCLIQLHLRMKSRGNLDDFSLICLPARGDFKRNLKQIKKANHEPVFTEPLLPDLSERERKVLRKTHKKLLKRLRARRVREKRKQQETSNMRVYIKPANTATIVAEQFQRMCKLWLPEDHSTLYSVRKQCQREVFGYATTAHFSYTEATVCAVGYVTPTGLRELLELCRQINIRQPMCLMRSPKSRHYRFACFKLNLDV